MGDDRFGEKIEITEPLQITEHEVFDVSQHSVRNVFSVLIMALEVLQNRADTACALDAANSLKTSILSYPPNWNSQEISNLLDALDDLYPHIGHYPEAGMIMKVIKALSLRLSDEIWLFEKREEYKHFSKADLENDIRWFFNTTSDASCDAWEVVYGETPPENGYAIHMEIGEDGLRMPHLFFDLIRDLCANARKYTNFPGVIRVVLQQHNDFALIRVEDTGCGIPENEIGKVVNYGYRAKNVLNKPTHGGGMGLTKAYFFTKKMKGHFWIASKIGSGTAIEIQIPSPNLAEPVERG